MGKFKFENQGTNTYLVCRLTGQKIDTMSLGMLTNNKIPGIAPAFYTQQDTELLIKYNISSHITMRDFFSGVIGKKRLLDMFSSIIMALHSAEEYMLDLNAVLLNLDYIFADPAGCSARLICVPILDMPEREYDFGVFFKRVMFSTQFDQTEDCGYVTQIINYLNGTATFSIDEFGRFLKQIDQEPVSVKPSQQDTTVLKDTPFPINLEGDVPETEGTTVLRTGVPIQADSKHKEEKERFLFHFIHHNNKSTNKNKEQKESQKQMKKEENQRKKEEKKREKKDKIKKYSMLNNIDIPNKGQSDTNVVSEKMPKEIEEQKKPEKRLDMLPRLDTDSEVESQNAGRSDFGVTTVLTSDTYGETSILKDDPQVSSIQPYLIRLKNREEISLNRPVFRIGKDRDTVDYPVSDNTAVSRRHAEFIIKDGNCYVMDMNSTNHTYINGKMIPSNAEMVLRDGDRICLANEEFQFKMM